MSIDNQMRYGRFTSSNIGDLMTRATNGKDFGSPALTYIKTRGMERRLQRSIGKDVDAKETSWGLLCEKRVFDMLGTDYNVDSKHTIVHPKYPFWAGSPDGNRFISEKTVYDCKAPFTLLSFCTFVDAWNAGGIDAIRKQHKSGNKYYWQLVSGAILTDSEWAELIVYCPYLSELDEIRLLLSDMSPEEVSAYRWMDYAGNGDLPYLIEGAGYKNLNIFRFQIPQEDKAALTATVLKAEALLNPQPHVLLAHNENGVTIIEAAN